MIVFSKFSFALAFELAVKDFKITADYHGFIPTLLMFGVLKNPHKAKKFTDDTSRMIESTKTQKGANRFVLPHHLNIA